jgi:hypothetical protein
MKRGVILLIAVLVLAGGVGWYVWDQNKNEGTIVNSQPSTQQSAPVANQQSGSDYLVIKEWGVRFKLPDNLKNDIDYQYIETNNWINFGSKKYADIQPYCSSNAGGVGMLFRTKDLNSISSNYKTVNHIGSYYYYSFSPSSYATGQASCNKNGAFSDVQLNDEKELQRELLNSFNSLMPA